jgi:hypothetical protein
VRRRLALWSLSALCVAGTGAGAAPNQGETIYRQGMMPSGAALTGERDPNTHVTGADAACAKCHRRSGLGSSEGQIIIPPITSQYLHHTRGRESARPDLRTASGFIPNRKPYDAASLVRAIRDGVDVSGRKLSYLMPRYKFGDADMAILVAYLDDFARDPTPGVSDDTLHFATIITPDSDPAKRQAMLDVLNQFFTDKNEFIRGGIRPMQAAGGVQFRVSRRWQLHVWELTGSSDSWGEQLDKRMASEPVFAVISGLGSRIWAPVHEFCERSRVPCLFPNTDLPVVAETDFYDVYFNKGVTLEAALIANDIRQRDPPAARPRIVQIFRFGDIGAAAASALGASAQRDGMETVSFALGERHADPGLAQTLRLVRPSDILVLWLRAADIAALPQIPAAAAGIYVSGLMANLEEAPLPPAWRGSARMSYPFDLPAGRKFRMNYPLAWLKIRHIAPVDERVQSNTYLACGILAEQLTSMQDNFVRDYLIERIEDMLSHRVLSGLYPRLGLAPGQRFASKGGYIVHFTESAGMQIAADTAWVVP